MNLDLSALFQSLREKLIAVADRIVNDRDEAEDVVQEAFLAVLEHPDRDIRHPNAFLRITVRNIALERVRSSRQELPLLLEPAAPSMPDEELQRLTGAVKSLAGRASGNGQRRRLWVIWKGLAEGRTQREIAIELGTTRDAVKALLRRSRRRLDDASITHDRRAARVSPEQLPSATPEVERSRALPGRDRQAQETGPWA